MKQEVFNRQLKSKHVTAIGIGGMIGTTYFLGTSYVFNQMGPFTFLAFLLGGLIAYLTLSCLAELSAASKPTHLSFVNFARLYISPAWACGVGWSYWVNWVVYIAAECLAGGILMHSLAPILQVEAWAFLFGCFVTTVNLLRVDFFGKITSWMAYSLIGLLVGFCGLSLSILLGWIGIPETPFTLMDNIANFREGMGDETLVFFICMIIMLNNYQGAEMIALSASESQNPQHDIPKALRKVGLQAAALLSLPILMLGLIFPWQETGVTQSIFSSALASYGLHYLAQFFTLVVILVALSSANSSFYATARTLHALSTLHMAPQVFQKMNRSQVPAYATYMTAVGIWSLIFISYFTSSTEFYVLLLALSGCTGASCWISICWSQYKFRKSLSIEEQKALNHKVRGFPYLTLFAIFFQVLSLCVLIGSPDLRSSVYFGLPCFFVPMLMYKFVARRRIARG